jgi:hypothetical protein
MLFASFIAASSQLTVLTTPAVIAAECGIFPIMRVLATHAQAHTGHCLASGFGNFGIAFLAMAEAGALRQSAAHALNPVFNCGVDLILNGAVTCPTCGHIALSACFSSDVYT